MGDDKMQLVRGSGNVYRDFGYADADVRQAKALLGAQIVRILGEEGFSTWDAEARTGIAYSELSRVRQAKFGRVTIDRLVGILGRLRIRGINSPAIDDRV